MYPVKQSPAMTCINRKHFKLPLLPKFSQQEAPSSAPPSEEGIRGPNHGPHSSKVPATPTMLGNPAQKASYPLPGLPQGRWVHTGLSRPSPGPQIGHPNQRQRELVCRRLGALFRTAVPGLTNVRASPSLSVYLCVLTLT